MRALVLVLQICLRLFLRVTTKNRCFPQEKREYEAEF